MGKPWRSPGFPGTVAGLGLVGRVTLTISLDTLANPPDHGPASHTSVGKGPPGHDPPDNDPPDLTTPGTIAAALLAAARAAARAGAQAQADAAAGGCAHRAESPAYQPPPRLQELVTARDLT